MARMDGRMVIAYIDPSEDNLIGSVGHTAMRRHCVDEVREKHPQPEN